MAQRDYELPAGFLEAGGQTLDWALSYFAAEYHRMFGGNVKVLEPVYRAAGNDSNPVQ